MINMNCLITGIETRKIRVRWVKVTINFNLTTNCLAWCFMRIWTRQLQKKKCLTRLCQNLSLFQLLLKWINTCISTLSPFSIRALNRKNIQFFQICKGQYGYHNYLAVQGQSVQVREVRVLNVAKVLIDNELIQAVSRQSIKQDTNHWTTYALSVKISTQSVRKRNP